MTFWIWISDFGLFNFFFLGFRIVMDLLCLHHGLFMNGRLSTHIGGTPYYDINNYNITPPPTLHYLVLLFSFEQTSEHNAFFYRNFASNHSVITCNTDQCTFLYTRGLCLQSL